MSDNPMRILVVEPTKDPYVKEIDGSLTSMQAIVGGFIQAVEPFEDPNVLLLCNEEAKLLKFLILEVYPDLMLHTIVRWHLVRC